MKKLLLSFACFVLVQTARAETKWWFFEDHPYYEPLIAGVREPHFSALFPARGKKIEFEVSKTGYPMIWDIDVGGELPIFGWQRKKSTDIHDRVSSGDFGWGLWIPIDFHMIEDLTDASGPIVNNDYRFGGMLKAQYGLPGEQWISVRVHGGHESTHLGDEFSIVGERQFRSTFERINVSWEYIDVGVLYERTDPQGTRRSRMTSTRFGITANVHGSYYATDPGSITVSARGPVTRSTNRYDPYTGLEFTWGNSPWKNWQTYTSAELRWRSVYDYHKQVPGASEARQASINLIAGIKAAGNYKASPFIRYYHGVNPHGQFRNQKDYSEYGSGVRLVR